MVMKIDLNQLFGLESRVAAVTGGGGELCGVMAEALADLGVNVAILDIHREHAVLREKIIVENGYPAADAISTSGREAIFIMCDVAANKIVAVRFL